MYVTYEHDASNMRHNFSVRVNDRTLASAFNVDELMVDIRAVLVQEIGKRVMAQLGPAIDQAIKEMDFGARL